MACADPRRYARFWPHLTRPAPKEDRMPLPKINAVATATPPHRFSQEALLALAGYDDPRRRGFFEKSGIEGRYLYIDPATFRPDETIDEAQERFPKGAPGNGQ